MRRVDYESGAFKVMGYAAFPSITESSRSSQTVSVNGRWVRAEGLTKGIDDAYRGTVLAGRYPPVALRGEVDPRQVDVNVHPTKQLVRFSDEREVRLALSKAISHAIQGTSESVPEQDARNTESETMDISSPPTSEGGTDTPLAVPERPPSTKDQLASETTSSVPLNKGSTSNNEGDSIAPTAFSEGPRAPAQSHQKRLTSRSNASASSKPPPLFLRLAPSRRWSGETCHALETCAW